MRDIFTCIVNNVETDYNVTCIPETVETVAGIYGPTLQSTFEIPYSLKQCKSYQFVINTGVVDYYSKLLLSFRHAKYNFECIQQCVFIRYVVKVRKCAICLWFLEEIFSLNWCVFIVGDFRPVVETTVQSTLSSTPDSTTVSYQGIAYDWKHF